MDGHIVRLAGMLWCWALPCQCHTVHALRANDRRTIAATVFGSLYLSLSLSAKPIDVRCKLSVLNVICYDIHDSLDGFQFNNAAPPKSKSHNLLGKRREKFVRSKRCLTIFCSLSLSFGGISWLLLPLHANYKQPSIYPFQLTPWTAWDFACAAFRPSNAIKNWKLNVNEIEWNIIQIAIKKIEEKECFLASVWSLVTLIRKASSALFGNVYSVNVCANAMTQNVKKKGMIFIAHHYLFIDLNGIYLFIYFVLVHGSLPCILCARCAHLVVFRILSV